MPENLIVHSALKPGNLRRAQRPYLYLMAFLEIRALIAQEKGQMYLKYKSQLQ